MSYVDELFRRVVFDEADRAYHKELYAKVKVLCEEIETKVPHNEGMHLAFQAFSLGLMHIGTALARAEKYNETDTNP